MISDLDHIRKIPFGTGTMTDLNVQKKEFRKGNSPRELIVYVVVVALVAFIGYFCFLSKSSRNVSLSRAVSRVPYRSRQTFHVQSTCA